MVSWTITETIVNFLISRHTGFRRRGGGGKGNDEGRQEDGQAALRMAILTTTQSQGWIENQVVADESLVPSVKLSGSPATAQVVSVLQADIVIGESSYDRLVMTGLS